MKTLVPVLWLSLNPETPPRGYWDQGILEDLFSNNLWNTGYEFAHFESTNGLVPELHSEGAIIVFPARAQVSYIDQLNKELKKLKWVILFFTGDEEQVFPYDKIEHLNKKMWIMSPREGSPILHRNLGTGYPPQINQFKKKKNTKDIDWFFSGQVTHKRRQECVEQLKNLSNGKLIETPGFTQGVPHKEYYDYLSRAKVAPAPSGPETPDSFRLFEALELACVPIADTRVPKGNFSDDYWSFFFEEEPPFPILKEYEQLPGYIEDVLNVYPKLNNTVFSWWIKKKREMALQLNEDLIRIAQLNPGTSNDELITVIVPTSPIKSHPDINIIDETIKSIRYHLPKAEIILTFDGVRKEQESRRDNYEEFIRRMLWKCNTEYKNVLPLIFDEHMHQTGMAKVALNYVQTPLILYMEQDTPLVTDEDINWESLINDMIVGNSNMIRFHFEAVIPKDHLHMMHGMDARTASPLMMTSQWSQRPHLASTAFYRRILENHFTEHTKSFIEDKMHGVLHEAYLIDGPLGWEQFKVHIYAPENHYKRSYHTDGRAGESKWDSTQVF